MILRFGDDDHQLRVEIDAPTSLFQGLGITRLGFPLSIDPRGTIPAGTPLYLTGQVWLGSNQADWLGFAWPDRALIAKNGEDGGTLTLTLTNDQLAAIERRRAGLDLNLMVQVEIVLGYDPGPKDAAPSAGMGSSGQRWPAAMSQIPLTLQDGQWERLLAQAAVGTSLAVVVPLPIGRDTPSTRAGDQLREALRKVNAGEYEDAVVTARKALEAFDGFPSEKSVVSAAPEARTRSYQERSAMLRHALHSIASLAAHDEPGIQRISWTRENALSIIAAVAAFVACAATGR
ncbi:MAG: hypothetical protein ABIP57_19755 [Jatrophihabitantaceae bacterium]